MSRAALHGPNFQGPKYQAALAALHAGRASEAERLLRHVVRQAPDHAEALHCLGIALHAQRQTAQALGFLDRSLRLRPDNAKAENNRAHALNALRRPLEALACLDRALALQPGDAELHYNRGNTLMALNRNDAALEEFRRATALNADLHQAWQNMGIVLTRLGQLQEALAVYETLLRQPRAGAAVPELRANRAGTLDQLNRRADALADCDAAIAEDPRLALAHYNASVVCLGMGDYERGWREWEWRWQAPEFWPHRPKWRQPTWLGQEDLHGKIILLDAEQGLGDTIQFCRYAPMVKARGGEAWLRAPVPLLPLLRTLDGIDRLVSYGERPQEFDFQTPLLSLPHAFGTTLQTVPAAVPYLCADPERVEKWRALLGPREGLRVGLAWSGNVLLKSDAQRSIALAELAPLFLPGIEFIAVQKDLRAGDQAAAAELGVRHMGEHLGDFADTAALISLLDLVISVDTSPAHLAGALAKPVWLMLHAVAEWRWLMDREDSPWYPTAKLFRQHTANEWPELVARVASDLAQFHAAHIDLPQA
jgi:tetratricopeptide (TPR) repeat protein